jgi:superfamily II DNA/RNA helicase
MRHPVNIRAESADETQTVPATAQFVYQAHDLDKPEIIARILQAENSGLTIIFTRTKRQAQRVADDLAERGFSAAPLHGDMAQIAREKAMQRFREGKVNVLVATDVAARGIDVEAVTHVINYTCPEDDKTYLHRIGRTGRAGATGIAVTFVDWSDLHRWTMINKALGLPFDEPVETYSTSPNLHHDMGIPSDAKGRIAPPKPTEGTDRPPRGGRGERAGGSERPARRRDRSRTRTRGGRPVQQTSGAAEPSGGGTSGTAADQGGSSGGSAGGSRNRSRRRRRRGGGSNGGDGGSASTE